MKHIKSEIILTYFGCILALFTINSCVKEETSAKTAPPCTVSGNTVNVGSTAGGQFYVSLATIATNSNCPYTRSLQLGFSNVTLNFSANVSNPGVGAGCILGGTLGVMDVGVQTCLDFTASGTPTSNLVALKAGHGYIITFPSGDAFKFIANSYISGNANVSYVAI